MPILDSILRPLVKRARDRLIRGIQGELDGTRAELAATRDHLAAIRDHLVRLSETTDASVRRLRSELRAELCGDSMPANLVLSRTGHLVYATPEERNGDGTRVGAMGYGGWEESVAAYRPAFKVAIDLLRSGRVLGPAVEFGTCTGFTARIICELLNAQNFDVDFYMYDSFEGLPEMAGTPDEACYDVRDHKCWYPGSMAVPPGYERHIWEVVTGIRPAARVHMVKGFFDRTLDAGLPKEKCSLIHMDCDIYTSAKYVLNKLVERDLLQDGCVVMFDDWNCNRANPKMGERRALAEFFRENPRWTGTPWFAYGWNGQTYIFHDGDAG